MPNPYVGPRAFLPGETIYGRDDELRELFYLLAADRIILLHAPSGAGKTSLIQAALVPRLLAEEFSVLPLIRVGIEPPADAPAGNRYLISTLLSLEEALPEAQQRPLADLLALGLDAYLAGRHGAAAPTGSEVLIFDQFEEVLTSSLADHDAKAQFFAELGVALRDRRRWALFAIREEYVAALEPLARPIPTGLSNTFRLELLGPAGAMRAIQGPALAAGVTFYAAAASALVDDLRRVSVQRPDGSAESLLGQAIEPVQLQVVCYRLWERLPPGAATIDAAMAESWPAAQAAEGQAGAPASAVDRALMEYYAERVRAVAEACGVPARSVRDWCERQLITADGLRGQVLQQQGSSAGLPNPAISGLIDAHLVRAEKRRGTTWYELAHDRLIAPIRQDNAAWRERHLSLLQRQAALWDQQGRPESLLLSGETLAAQERAAAQAAEAPSALDRAFLDACLAARAAAERAAHKLAAERARAARERRQLRLISALAAIAGVALVAAIGLALLAKQSSDREAARAAEAQTARADAEQQRGTAVSAAGQARTAEARSSSAARLARANELAARARLAPYQQALLLAAAAAHTRLDAGEPPPLAATQALIDALAATGGRGLSVPRAAISAYALSPDGQRLAVGTGAGELRIYDPRAADLAAPLITLPGVSSAAVTSLAFSPDGQALAVGMFDASAAVYSLAEPAAPPQVRGMGGSDSGPIRVAFAAGGRRLLLLGEQEIWLGDPAALLGAAQIGETLRLSTFAISPDGRWLAVAYQGGPISRWDLAADPPGPATEVAGPGHTVGALAFSPDARWLVGGTPGGQLLRWEIAAADPAATLAALGEHNEGVNLLAVSPDGQRVASASDDTTVRLWSLNQPGAALQVLGENEQRVRAVAFSPDGQRLASAGEDGTVRLWDLSASPPEPQLLRGHEEPAVALAFSAQGDLLISRSDDGTLRLWNSALPLILDARGCAGCSVGTTGLALSPDGRTLAVGADTGGAIFDLGAADPAGSARRLPGADVTMQVAFGGGGRWLIMTSYMTATSQSQLRVLDLRDPALGAALQIDNPSHFAVSADQRWLALNVGGGELKLYDLRADQLGEPAWQADPFRNDISDLAVAPGGRWLAMATSQGLLLWDTQAAGAEPRADPASGLLAFSPDGRWLAIGEAGQMRVLDLSAPDAAPRALPGQARAIRALAFSPDGRRLAAIDQRNWDPGAPLARGDGLIYLRDVGPGGPSDTAVTLSGTTDSVTLLAFSPDGNRLLSGGKAWDLQAGGMPIVLRTASSLAGAALSADGSQAISAARDGLVRIWELRPAELAELACRSAGRALSAEERALYFADQPDQADPCRPPSG